MKPVFRTNIRPNQHPLGQHAAKKTIVVPRVPHSNSAMMRRQIAYWRVMIDLLPMTASESCFLRNWLASACSLWETGHYHAADYQLKSVRKRLNQHVRQNSRKQEHLRRLRRLVETEKQG